jgi:hypothetical protein
MNKNLSWVLSAIVVLVLTSLGCNVLSSLPGSGSVLEDDFSKEGNWGTSTDSNSSIEYSDGGLRMKAFTNNYFIWSTPNTEKYENVHVEVTAKNNDTPATTAFGILCHQQQPINDLFYYFVMTPAGEYAIAETSLTQTDVFLTNNDQWAQSDAIAVNAPSYRLGADCGNGTLTFYVDGQQIASVSDDTNTSGSVGLLMWSGEDASSADVTFDDFVVTKLQ